MSEIKDRKGKNISVGVYVLFLILPDRMKYVAIFSFPFLPLFPMGKGIITYPRLYRCAVRLTFQIGLFASRARFS